MNEITKKRRPKSKKGPGYQNPDPFKKFILIF